MAKVLDYINIPYLNKVDAKINDTGIHYQQYKII